MPFRAKATGLRAAVETNLRDKAEQQTLTLANDEAPAEPGRGTCRHRQQFKTIRLEAQDYAGADKTAANCPTARAIRRVLRKDAATGIAAWANKVRIGDNCYALPAEVTEADRAYCNDGKVTLLEFQLSNQKVTC